MKKDFDENKKCDCGSCHDHCEDEHCDCGCEDNLVTLTGDDGKEYPLYFIDSIEYEGKTYAVFESAEDGENVKEGDIYIFETQGEEENTALLPVEDQKVLDAVFNKFCELVESYEDEELSSKDDCDCDDENCDCHHHEK